jgi:hypothetical protein
LSKPCCSQQGQYRQQDPETLHRTPPCDETPFVQKSFELG